MAATTNDPTPEHAARMVQGLRALAACDGLHAAELALIDELEADAGLGRTRAEDFSFDGLPQDEAFREHFLRSAWLLALADGRVSDAERAFLERLGAALGADGPAMAEAERASKRWLLRRALGGVQLFRDQAAAVGRSLGLSDDEIDAALREA